MNLGGLAVGDEKQVRVLEDGDPERALSVANACGAVAANDRGSRPALSWERVEAVMA